MIRPKTIKGLLIQNIFIGFIIILFSGVLSIKFFSNYMRREISQKSRELILVLTSSINSKLEQPVSDLQNIKALIEDDRFSIEPAILLNNFVKNRDYLTKLQLTSFEGKVIELAPFKEEFKGIDVSRQEYFINSSNSVRPYWSSTILSAQFDEPFVSVSLRTDIGVLTAFVNPSTVLSSLRKIVNRNKSFITVTDRTGIFIVHNDQKKIQQRVYNDNFNSLKARYKGETLETTGSIEGTEELSYSEFIPKLGWLVEVHQSLENFKKPVSDLIKVLAVLSVLALSLFSLFTFRFIYKAGKTLTNLVQTTVKVSDGDYSFKVQETDFVDINSVIKSFNQMGDHLFEREKQLIDLNDTLQIQLDRVSHAELTFKTLLESTSGKFGQEYLDNLVLEIAKWFNVDMVLVSHFDLDNYTGTALAMYVDGKLVKDYSYPLKGSPCERVAEEGYKFYTDGVAELFPEDKDLVDMNARSYIGVPMFNTSGGVRGIICAVSREELTVPEWARDVMAIISSKTAAEIERMEAEAEILKNLSEKEIMLKEIHHRVKNNMQVVISLLNLQMETSDEETRGYLEEAVNRIYVMAIIHQKLYQTEDLTKVVFKDYCKSLLDKIIGMSKYSRNMQIKIDVDDVTFSIEQLIPLGLIINELVTNAIKHAYKDVKEPSIEVVLRKSDDECYMIIRDNGKGFDKDFSIEESDSLGMQLVSTLSMQLKGETKIIDSNDGGEVKITMGI